MNGKKAKAIRRMCRELGHYKDEPEYVAKKHKRIAHVIQDDGSLKLQEVEKLTIVNKSRVAYRKAKRMYKNGEFTI